MTDLDALTSALIEANDQLLALYDLAYVTSNTLSERDAVTEILQRASRIVSADAMVLISGNDVFGTGSARDRRLLGAAADDGGSERPGDDVDITSVAANHASGLGAELRVLRRDRTFTTGDRKLLSSVLRTTIGAISIARLHDQVLRRALDNQDQKRASEIAQLALPEWRPELPHTSIFVANEPARETGGDLYCYAVDGDDLTFAVGDVSGKGLTAAVMMTTAISAANAAFRDSRSADPAAQLSLINQWMFEHLSAAGLFITLFIGRYRAGDGVLTWVNAGHSPCLVHRNRRWDALAAQTPPVGVLPDVTTENQHLELGPGDLIVIGSDGLVEQEDRAGEPFGDDRLRHHLDIFSGRPLTEVGNDTLASIDEHADGQPRFDDRTLLLLRRDA